MFIEMSLDKTKANSVGEGGLTRRTRGFSPAAQH